MNLITKLLMENETTVITLPSTCAFHVSGERTNIVVVVPKCVYDVDTKKELLAEVPEQYYVSGLEWELLNYWKEIGVEKIYKNKNNDDIVLCELSDHYLQPSSMYQIFQFIKHEEYYVLDDLINHCALIEG